MLKMKGFPIMSIQDNGQVVLSEMMTDKGLYDPIAGKLLSNMIWEMIKQLDHFILYVELMLFIIKNRKEP